MFLLNEKTSNPEQVARLIMNYLKRLELVSRQINMSELEKVALLCHKGKERERC